MIGFLLALHLASYAAQRSSGVPLNDTATVRQLARFDDVTLEITPWAQDVNGAPRTDVLMRLRALNPHIRLWLYCLAGDQWLPPTFVPGAWDHSGFRDVFDAVQRTHGWLYGTDGQQWYPNVRVDLANSATTEALGAVYERLLSTHLFDGIFLDDCHTSIAWTNNGQRTLDTRPFRTPAAMDSARAANVARLIQRLHMTGGPCFLVARNGTGPRSTEDYTMREGVGVTAPGFESVDAIKNEVAAGGGWWLKSEAYDPATAVARAALLRDIAAAGENVIISLGPNRDWPPVLP